MKKLILTVFTSVFLVIGLQAQQYHDSIPMTCNPNVNGTEVITHTMAAVGATANGTLKIDYTGDFSVSGEFVEVYSEGGTLLHTLNGTGDCVDETPEYVTLNKDSINDWASDGQITFTYTAANASTSVNNFCGPGGNSSFCIEPVLDYPYSVAPNDIGISKLDTPGVFCTPTQNIYVSATNYGTNQVDTFSVGWEINGVAQTSQTFYNLLDTAGGTGSTTASVGLGSVTINNPDTFKFWTFTPNNTSDTINANDTLEVIIAPSLGGTYTIGGTSPDYADFTSAITDLNKFGVCAPVVFEVDGSIFNEQITLTPVTGASATNTITFRGTAGSELTSSTATSTTNYTVNMDGADYITFDSLTISNTDFSYMHVFEFGNGADNNTISNCVLYNDTTPSSTSTYDALVYSNGSIDENNTFKNNLFHGGSYALYWYGVGTTSLESGTVVEGNEFKNQYYDAVRLYYQNRVSVKDNHIYSNSTYSYADAVYLYYCDSGTVFSGNIIESSPGGNWPDNGLYMYYNDASASEPALVYNNMIQVGDTFQTSARYAAYVYRSDYVKFYNNNLNVLGTSTSNRALYDYYGSNKTYYNNNFAAGGSGYAAYFNSTSTVDSSDYNNFYAETSTTPIYYSGAVDLSTYQSTSGRDSMSVSYDPLYFAHNDLHSCQNEIRDKGMLYNGLTVDIDGQTRNTNASIGADEFFAATPGFLGSDIEKCPSDTVTLGAMNAVGTFMWNTGSIASSLTTTSAGTYYLQASTYCGSGTDTVVVTNLPTSAAWSTSQVSYLTVVFDGPSGFDNYKWYFGDGDTANIEDPLHIYPTIGTYTATLVASNKCGSYTDAQQITVTNVGMEDLAKGSSVKVYPNPSKGSFNVDLNNFAGENAELRVIDIQGKTVFSEQYNIANDVMKEQINLNTANSGIYYLKVIAESGTTVRKIIVE